MIFPRVSPHCKLVRDQHREFENVLLQLPEEYAEPSGNNCQLLSVRGRKIQ